MALETFAVAAAAPNPDKIIRVARSWAYPKQVLWLIASCIVLLSIINFISLAWRYLTRRRIYSSPTRGTISIKRLPSAIVDTFRALVFRWTIPVGPSFAISVFEFVLCAGYVAALISWTFANSTSVHGDKFDAHYYANRAATIAASQLPILAALGMRNNIIALLTGISSDKINLLHRTAARALCILGWIHASGRLELGLTGDEVISQNRWVQCGALALSSLTLLCLLSLRPVRKWNYEFFILIHFIFAFMIILALYFHLRGRSLTHWGIWPTMVIWGVDRFLSLLRIAAFNFPYLNPFSSRESKRALDASIQVLSPLFLRVSFKRPAHFRWRPGQSAFVCFPTVSALPWELHPFTISSLPNSAANDSHEVVFLLRVHKGLTARLLKEASEEKTYPVLVNGPYSNPPVLVGYNTVVLIAGGSGISFTLPLFLHLASESSRNKSQRVVFIWVVRDADLAQCITSFLENIPTDLSVSVKIFVTSGRNTESLETSARASIDDEKTDGPKSLDYPFVSVDHGRPNISALITEEIAKACGRMSVNVCGPSGLVEATRAAIRKPRPIDILKGGPTISFHVEGFGG